MSRRCSKLHKTVKFSEKDYVIIRPLTHDEMVGARESLASNSMMSEFLKEMGKLLDKGCNAEVNAQFKESFDKIKEVDDKKTASLKEYNDAILKCAIVKVFDDGVEELNIESYLNDIDFKSYEKILTSIYELCIPDEKKQDFLEEGQETLPVQ